MNPPLLLAALLSLQASAALAQKVDVTHLRDGNVSVGEVNMMHLGLLETHVDYIVAG